MSTKNLKNLTMAFAVATATEPLQTTTASATAPKVNKAPKPLVMHNATSAKPTQSVPPTVAAAGKVTKPLVTRNATSPRLTTTPKAPATVKSVTTPASTGRDANSLLSNNFRLFAVVGTTTFKGSTKIWFANEIATKVKNMEKQGHVDIEFISLPNSMTKADALKYLAANPGQLSVDKSLATELVIQKTQKLTSAFKRQAHAGVADSAV